MVHFIPFIHTQWQSVVSYQVVSSSLSLLYCIPQGSVLGSVLFTLYTQPLADIINNHSFIFQTFADDTPPSQVTSIF